MDCKVCKKGFNKDYLPTLLECGHTICKSCTLSLYKSNHYVCPYDFKKLTVPPHSLCPNYDLIEYLESNQKHAPNTSSHWKLLLLCIFLTLLLKFV